MRTFGWCAFFISGAKLVQPSGIQVSFGNLIAVDRWHRFGRRSQLVKAPQLQTLKLCLSPAGSAGRQRSEGFLDRASGRFGE